MPLLPQVSLGQLAATPWAVQDWLAFRDERLGIRQYDGGASEAVAARGAWLDCLQRWLERHPPVSVAPEVWPRDLLRFARISEAVHALAQLGIHEPPE